MPAPPHDLLPGRLVAWDHDDPARVVLRYERVVAEVSVGVEGVVRLRAALGAALPEETAAAIGRDPWQPVALEAREQGGAVRVACELSGPAVELAVAPIGFDVRVGFRGTPGTELRDVRLAAGGGARFALRMAREARFHGFGEKAGGLDKRGKVLEFRTRDAALNHDSDPLYVSIPFFLASTHAASLGPAAGSLGVFVDCFARSVFDVARSQADEVRVELAGGPLDVYVLPGPRPADVVRRFTALVGRTPLPPRWALGHHQSRWSYASDTEVRRIAADLRARAIPTDAIHLDIDHMDGFRVFTWNRRAFPDPAALAAAMADSGFRLVAIVDPGVKVDDAYSVYADGLARGVFCRRVDGSLHRQRVWPGDSVLPDFQREDVRAWWAAQHAPLLASGIAGVWNDMNEPAGWKRDIRFGRFLFPFGAVGTRRLRQADPTDARRLLPHEDVRNLYALQQCRATRSALEAARPGERPFVLTRSGYAGIQRFAAVWTGDNASRWSHLRRSIPMLLNLSLSGVAFCGADIGGFSLSCTSELYARWIQIGSLYPLARTHSMWLGRLQEPHAFGARTEEIARRALSRRMRLLPYLDGLFHECERSGLPLWRPMFLEFPEDAASYGIDDQVMLGPSLLLAPVLHKRARRRSVYLPPGLWCAFDSGAVYGGGRRVEVEAPLAHMPIFVRTPAVVPMQSLVQHDGEKPAEPLVLEVFAPRRRGSDDEVASFAEVHDDDGRTTTHRDGQRASTRLRVVASARSVVLEVGARVGGYAVAPRRVRAVLRGAGGARSLVCDGLEVPVDEGSAASGALWARRRGADLEVGYLDDGRAVRLTALFDSEAL